MTNIARPVMTQGDCKVFCEHINHILTTLMIYGSLVFVFHYGLWRAGNGKHYLDIHVVVCKKQWEEVDPDTLAIVIKEQKHT